MSDCDPAVEAAKRAVGERHWWLTRLDDELIGQISEYATAAAREALKPVSLDGVTKEWASVQAETVGTEIKRLRGGQSGQWLSDRTAELGYRVARTTISELENGKRKYIGVAELVVLAAALETAPVALLYPLTPSSYDESVDYLPNETTSKFDAAQRFSGIFDPKRDTVSAAYWQNTLFLRSEREVRNRRHSIESGLESNMSDEFHSATIKLIDDLIDTSRLSPNGKGADDTDAIYELVHIITDDGGVPLPPPAEMTFGLAYALAVAIRRLAVM